MRNSIIIAFAVTLVVFVGLQSQPASAETYHFSLDGNDIKNAFGRFMNGGKSEKSKKDRNSSKHRGKQASSRHRNVNQPAYVPQKAEKIPASWKVEEKTVGPAPDAGNIYWLSPKGMHLAAVHMEGSRFVVSIDGVAGEKFNEILHAAVGVDVEYDANGMVRRAREKWRGPVAFSPDGSRYAYAARQGKEAVVILDGKEIYRDVYKKAIPPLIRDSVSMLSFTPDGKHLFFYAQTGQLMMDAHPVTPKLRGMPWPFFSADGSRWGLLAKPFRPYHPWNGYEDGGAFMTVIKEYIKQSDEAHREAIYIDGKEVAYNCQHPRFTLDGKHVVCTQDSNGKQSLLVDGAPLMTVNRIEHLVLSPNGDIAVIASDNEGKQRLYINGKPVPGGEDAYRMMFSPDGKRWAAVVRSNPEVWVVVDGKKQMEYDNISDVKFTPDSSKIVYIAKSGKKKFVVVNGEEDRGARSVRFKPMFGKTGHHVTYVVRDGQERKDLKIYHDGKASPNKSEQVAELSVSPDGAHYAYHDKAVVAPLKLVVDGDIKGGAAKYMHVGKIFFSPDSQHVATIASPQSRGRLSIYRDGKFVSIPRGINYVKVLGFSSDSQHLLIKGNDNTGNVYFLDGKRVANFHLKISSGIVGFPRLKSWEMQPDGSVVLIGHVPIANNNGGVVKRIRVIPKKQSESTSGKGSIVY